MRLRTPGRGGAHPVLPAWNPPERGRTIHPGEPLGNPDHGRESATGGSAHGPCFHPRRVNGRRGDSSLRPTGESGPRLVPAGPSLGVALPSIASGAGAPPSRSRAEKSLDLGRRRVAPGRVRWFRERPGVEALTEARRHARGEPRRSGRDLAGAAVTRPASGRGPGIFEIDDQPGGLRSAVELDPAAARRSELNP